MIAGKDFIVSLIKRYIFKRAQFFEMRVFYLLVCNSKVFKTIFNGNF